MSQTIILNGAMLGLGLALEAFAVAMANGLYNANYGVIRAILLALLFALCHFAALAAGYALIGVMADAQDMTELWLTAVAVSVLLFIGIKMLVGGLRKTDGKDKPKSTAAGFAVQSVAASFDAFAVGLTLTEYSVMNVAVCGSVIFAIISAFYSVGFMIGKKFGVKFSKYASVLGGIVFIGIAAEILISALV